MTYIPLSEHTHPRVLMLDFSLQDVSKIQKAGFETRRGATGLHDRKEFYLPFAIQDIEVLFAQVQTGSFTSEESIAAVNSVEERPFFRDLMREIWQKAGWSVLFISQNTKPDELAAIGLERLGVIARERQHIPESLRKPLQKAIDEHSVYERTPPPVLPPAQIPRFVGQSVHLSDEPEAKILERYVKSAKMSILPYVPQKSLSESRIIG